MDCSTDTDGVIPALDGIVAERVVLVYIRMNNRPEFISRALLNSASDKGIAF
ncbi:hypothetical protein [Ferrimicrobium acidiphilum]|uniref:hypothetical protein n=1 Tax=Ferrimicrobium acidiphilum TaxID=121039 RepID=UPI0014706E58|nr:hypothetical protein [Ferrimicrobium acidiphilum]